MNIDRLNILIDEALEEGQENNLYARMTNAANASHALGKYHALLNIIKELFGFYEFVKTYERTKETAERLLAISYK